jgi:hypothetical protein
MAGEIDYYEAGADWLKTRWSLPPYRTSAFFSEIEETGLTLAMFQKRQMYLSAVRTGLIVDDKWTGRVIEWGDPWLRDMDFQAQMDLRFEHARGEMIGRLADAQGEANRALTKGETGLYLIDYLDDIAVSSVDESDINVGQADTSGIEDLRPTEQGPAWFAVMSVYSSFMSMHLAELELPQIWEKKGARAVYYPERNLIVVPTISPSTVPQLVHAGAHYIETLGRNLEAVDMARNALAMPGTLHMIRPGLYSLRGPWIDQHDGALRGYDQEWLTDKYENRRIFTRKEISRFFTGRPTEYLAMMAQRVARRDPVEIATLWSRVPDQILLYVTLAKGNYMEAL